MKLTTIACALTAALALTSIDVLADKTDEHHVERVLVSTNDGGDYEINVTLDDDQWQFDLSEEQLASDEELNAVLADLPESIKPKIVAMLKREGALSGRVLALRHGDGEVHRALDYAFAFGDDDEQGHHRIKIVRQSNGDDDQPIIRIHRVGKQGLLSSDIDVIKDMTFPNGASLAGHLAKIIERHEFSAQALQELQAAIDAKQ